jgi:hypothetical protein
MSCPYCASEISQAALACPVCRRDLYLVNQLNERIAELEIQLAGRPPAIDGIADESSPPVAPQGLPAPAPEPLRAAINWLLPLLLLLLAHWLIIFIYDAKPLYLRLLALLLPLPFGFMFARALHLPFAWNLLPAFAMAICSVFGMSGITALIDRVPVLPQNMLELREFIEFSASIAFSFITGLWLYAWGQRRVLARAVRDHLGGLAKVNGQKVSKSLSGLNDIGSALIAFATTAFSIYTGLKSVLGG